MPDVVVVGSGPNGLAAAITMAREGLEVLVLEGRDTVGGGTRTAELTLPGFRHDVCSAIHPLGMSSPFFRRLPLREHGLEWIQPDLPVAHPLAAGEAAYLDRSVHRTADGLPGDGAAWRRVMGGLERDWPSLEDSLLAPLRVPAHPVALVRFGLKALWPASSYARWRFRTERARALFAGLAGHSILPLERMGSAAFGLVLGTLGHVVGWPMPRGGSQAVADALAGHLAALGGTIRTGCPVRDLRQLPAARAVLLDLTPRQFLALAGDRLPARYRGQLQRYRYGPGVFKLDWALDGPIPWTAPECRRAGTVHVGGTLADIAASERAAFFGRPCERPFVLLAQQSLFDPTRAPAGRHTAWGYCHVPKGSRADMTAAIEAQVERYAPGFRDRILARHAMGPGALESYNPNYVGGDINGGVQDLLQLYTRPVARAVPYSTPLPGVFLCSSSTPPGGGVHGMCGFHAANAALAARFGKGTGSVRGR